MRQGNAVIAFCAALFLIIIFAGNLNAQSSSRSASSMKKPDFITLAQDNDTLEALVHLFFRKRKEARTGYLLAGASFGAFVVGSVAFAVGSGLAGGDDPENEIQAGAVIFSAVFYTLIIGSTTRLIRYNKQKLYNLMQSYPLDGQIPPGIKNNLRPRDFGPK
ncbi:MAG: hypothetical protein LWX09_00485 [Bacteroidia bacterium]|nr:hypothetical protein [Bacteroidia bacterium]